MSKRLVFGESLSPDRIRAVQRAAVEGHCALRGLAFWRGENAATCAACQVRSVCGQRRDDEGERQRLHAEAETAVRNACRDGDPCPFRLEFGGCDCRGDLFAEGYDPESERGAP